MKPLLRMQCATLVRGGRLLIQDLDLELGPGAGLLLAGPNGSGKSSLIRLAAGLLRPQAGEVWRQPAALADDRPALDGELPLREALAFWASLGGGRKRLAAAMAALGLEPLAEVPVRLLSAGQARRAALARVAASGAPLWLLDEPLNGLDAASVGRLAELIAQHRSSGGAVLAASHLPIAGDWRQLELGR